MKTEKMLIEESVSVLEAMQRLDEVATKILFVVEKGILPYSHILQMHL